MTTTKKPKQKLDKRFVKNLLPENAGKKIDVGKAIELKLMKNLSNADIAKHFGCTPSAVQQRLAKFEKILQSPEELETYRRHKVDILESAEFTLIRDLLDGKRRKAASLNNVAYALQNVNNIARLEKGQATNIIENRLDPEFIKVRKAEIVTELQRRGLVDTPQDIV